MPIKNKFLLAITILTPFLSGAVLADDEDEFEDDLESFYGDEDFVSIATGTKKSIEKAPSVASVITAEEIKNIGARNLAEVLDTIPGLHASKSGQNLTPEFWFRGITSTYNPQTLIMVNGVSIKSVVRGDAHTVWGEFPIQSIERIEIIRGPGSALHGADAFSGVINIITKRHGDIDQTTFGAMIGEFNTQNVWLNTGGSLGNWDIGFSFEALSSDGYEGVIETDAQTIIDQVAAGLDIPPASLAPGLMSTGFRSIDFWLMADSEYFSVDLGLQLRDEIQSGQGITETLDNEGEFGGDKEIIKVSLKSVEVSEYLKVDGYINYYRSNQKIDRNVMLFPRGAFFGAFPDGFIGNPGWEEDYLKLETSLRYDGIKDSLLTFGLGYEKQDLYEVTESKNFNADLTPRSGGLEDVTDTAEIFMPEADRENKFFYVQLESRIAPDWELVLGARQDDYSDFGSTVNPRAALVWSTSLNLTTKFLYGRAFRAPAIAELLTINNPVALGNPDLDPEMIDTFEVAFAYKFSPELHIDFNFFRYDIEDFITFVPDVNGVTATAQNLGQRKGVGFESSVDYKFSNDLRLRGNFSFIEAEDKLANDEVGEYPARQSYLRLEWKPFENFKFIPQLTYISERERVPGDPREELEGYMLTNLLSQYQFNENSQIELIISNAFDDDVREPSSAGTTLGQINIPNDLPQAGRAVYLRYSMGF